MSEKARSPLTVFTFFLNRKQFLFPVIFSLLAWFSLILPISLRPAPSLLEIGDVAFQDFHAPRSYSYSSKVLTEEAQNNAEKQVTPVFDPADTKIAQQQLDQLRSIYALIAIIRDDPFATESQKINDLQSIQDLNLFSGVAQTIVELSETRWEKIQTESLRVLELIMRNTIREDQVQNFRRNIIPLISFEFSQVEIEVINSLVSPLVKSNSAFSSEKTQLAIQTAREAVEPITKYYANGEIIVRSGQVITPAIFEALSELGYFQPQDRLFNYISALLTVTVIVLFVSMYLIRINRSFGEDIKGLSILGIVFLIFLYLARFILPNHAILPYLFPVAAFGLVVSSLYGYEFGLIASFSLSFLTAYDNAADLSSFYFISSAAGIFVLGRGRRISHFLLAGLAIGSAGSAVVIALRIINQYLDLSGLLTLVAGSFFNGLASVSICLILQSTLSGMLGRITALQLMDLSRPDHPLIQEMLTNAPGTYQHSLQVANLAEQAAKAIKADPLIIRVGALYHDIGKTLNPSFFIENQAGGNINTHDNIDPLKAATLIIRHVTEGLNLAQKYKLPSQISDFISQHHGTTITRYQYSKALKLGKIDSEKDKNKFRYPGPKPQNKETALLMLADGCEAHARADNPESIEAIRAIVEETIDYSLKENQLVDSPLTLKDISKIADSFTKTLLNTYHQRIPYPEDTSAKN